MLSSAVLTFADPYDYQRSVRAADLKVIVAARGKFQATLTRIDLNRLWMQRSRLSLPTVTHSTVHKDRNPIFFLAEAEQIPITHSGIRISPGDIVFNSSGAEHHHRTSANTLWGAVSLTADDLATFGQVFGGRDLTAPVSTRVVRPQPLLMSRLLKLHKAAADLAAIAPEILSHPEVAKALEQELVRTMIACLTDSATEESYRSNRHRSEVMRRFERILDAYPNRPLYIAEVCAEIGASDRTLRSACQEHLGLSPHRYLWLRRMNLARRALALADPSARTVTEVANDYGFGELGRFSVTYRQLFAESPSATLRRQPDDSRACGTGRYDHLISDSAQGRAHSPR
jgi:AraC-like DNA-binding protein